MKSRSIWNSSITDLLLRWRYGPYILIAGWGYVHAVLVYEIITGRMRLRFSFEWIEGRESAPILYWSYIAGFAVALLAIDAYFIRHEFLRLRRNRPIQSPQPTAASRRG